MKIKKESVAIYTSIFSLLVAVGSLFINWGSFIVKDRPYIKIAPITFKDTEKFYEIEEIDQSVYALNFKFQMKNIGPTSANNIYVDHIIHLFIQKVSERELSEEDVRGKYLKKQIAKVKHSDIIETIEIPKEQVADEELLRKLDELENKDVTISPLYRKWQTLSLSPGDSFEYISGMKVSGKDANWFLENFDKERYFWIEVRVTYRGILPKIGRPYYSIYKGIFDENELFPYETKSY